MDVEVQHSLGEGSISLRILYDDVTISNRVNLLIAENRFHINIQFAYSWKSILHLIVDFVIDQLPIAENLFYIGLFIF